MNGDVTPISTLVERSSTGTAFGRAGVEAESALAITTDATVHRFPTIGERLVEAGGQLGRWQYNVIRLAADLDASDEWLLEANTAAHWIADALDMCVSTAREWVRIGGALRDLPLLDEQFSTHGLSYSKVRTLSRVATTDNEADLIEIAHRHPANRLGVELAAYLKGTEPDHERRKRHHDNRFLNFWTDADGMVHGRFCLPPFMAATLLAMIEAIVMRWSRTVNLDLAESAQDASAGASEKWPSLGQQRADALVALADGTENPAQVNTEIVIHVRGDGCALDDGTPISNADVEAIAPTSFIRALIHDADGKPINASGRQRHPTARQKRVVKERDRGCIDCGSNELPEYDHEPAFEQTRHTIVDELSVRCAPCHRRRHRGAV